MKLILKGGGCENTNAQYSLPAELDHLGRADRTLDGVRKCILHAVWKAQGKGCSPGAVGVCIGGDRTSGYLHAKEQLFRTLDDVNPDPRLAEIEDCGDDDGERADRRPNGVRREDVAHRLQDRRAQSPARQLLRLDRLRLLGVSPARRDRSTRRPARSPLAVSRRRHAVGADAARRRSRGGISRGRGARSGCRAPITDEQIRALKVGDVVLISGRIVHRPRRRSRAPDEARSAGRPSRRRALSLRSGRREGTGQPPWPAEAAKRRRRLDGDCRGPDHQHPRRAIPGRDPEALRRARRDRQGRHGRENAGRVEGIRGGLPQRDRRRGAVLRALHRARRPACR